MILELEYFDIDSALLKNKRERKQYEKSIKSALKTKSTQQDSVRVSLQSGGKKQYE